MVCLPVGPRCDSCGLSTAGLCPSAKMSGDSKKRKAIVKGSPGPEVEIAPEVKDPDGSHFTPKPPTAGIEEG